MIGPQLKILCERIARLEEEKKTIVDDIKEVKKEAESAGYDAALVTRTVAMMRKTDAKREKAIQQHDLFGTYLNAVGLANVSKMSEAA